MRKLKLLLAAATLMVGGMTVNAQIVSGTTYYLQNKASGRFISSGHGWFTRSTLSPVLDYPIQLQLNASGDGYILKIVGSNQLGHNLFVDNGSNNVWTVTAVSGEDNVYTIANGTNYLGYDGTFVLSSSLTDSNSDAAKWYIRTKDDYLALFPSASAEDPVDASFYITGPSYDYTDTNRNSAWTMSGFGAGTELGRGSGTTAINPYVVERYNGTGSIKQTLTGLKKGMYGVTVYGFYRAGNNNTATAARTEGNEAQNAIFYAGSAEKPLKSVYDEAKESAVAGSFTTSTSYGYVPNARSTAGECFANGYYKNTVYVYVENDDASLEIGVKKDATIAEDWAIIDNWAMTYYGSEKLTETEIVLADAVKSYKAALANAQAYLTEGMFDEAKTTLTTAINDNTLDLTGTVSEEQLTTATTNLNDAAKAAAEAAKKYTTYTTANTLINGGNNIDLTSLIVNPSFESGMAGWTYNGIGTQNNTSFGKTGTNYAEAWQPNGTKSVSQTIGYLPAGLYELTVKAKARGLTSAKVFAAGIDVPLKIADEDNTYTVNFALDDKSDALVGLEAIGTGAGSSWIAFDNFTLKYVGGLPSELTAAEGPMNNNVAEAQTTAVAAYNSVQNVANYNAAQAAIAAAEASIAAYASAATAIADAKALKEAHNFASETAANTFAEAIAAIEGAYNEATLTDDNATAAGITLGVSVSDWRANINGAAVQYMNDGFSITAYVDNTLYVNTWSNEGATDGSNFTVPFYEYWTSDANSLGTKTWTGTLTNLPNGLYSVTALVRVKAKTDTDAADATGITMTVNEGEAVDVTEGNQIGTSQFQLKEYTAEGLVKEGKLTLNFDIAADNNISWLSFKNVKYTKVRDLTEEEQIVPATENDYLALNAAITDGEAKVLGFQAGEYAPYNNIEAIALLAVAKAYDQTAINEQEKVQATTAALSTAWVENAEEVNAIYDGTFAAATNNGAPAGWRMSNNTLGGDYHSRAFVGDDRLQEFNQTNSGLFLRFDGTNSNRGSMYYYGDTEGYTMPLKAETYYRVTVDFAGWGSTGKPLRMNVTGPEGFTAVNQLYNTSVRADNANNDPQQFNILFKTAAAGNYVINFQTPGADSNTHNVVISNLRLFTEPETTATLAVTDAKYGTFIAPFDVEIPAGVTAYTVDGAEGPTLTMTEVETITANTPVVLFSETVVNEEVSGYSVATQDAYTVGKLTGVYTETDAPVGSYVLQNNNSKVAFYLVAEGKQPKVDANRAYLNAPSSGNNVRAAYFFDGETTGIKAIEALASGDATIFNASGAQVPSLKKGMNIIRRADGSTYKVIVK
jgi:hypothetical protein